jgi:hypothetical protein
MTTVSQIEDALQAIFGHADQVAHDTGFVQRRYKGKLTGARFAVTQTLGLLVPGGGALSDLAYFATHVGAHLSAQALDQRFGETTASFFKELLNIAFTQLVAADPVAIPLLQRFSEVIVEDSSTFSLPDDLQAVWQGCGGRTEGTLSAFKIQVRWDLCSGAFKGMALQDGKTPDTRSPLKQQRRCACSVRDADLGYFDSAVFQQEEEAGEYYFSRYKPGNLKLFDEQGQEMELVSFLQANAHEQAYECWVQVGDARRVRARLLAIPVPEEVAIKRQSASKRKAQKHSRKVNPRLLDLAHWTLLLTNIPREELSIGEALILLRLRWQIELLFKLWKHYAQADTSRSQQPWHVLCDFYAKLLGMLIVHWLMIAGCWQVPSRSMVKASKAICSQLVLLAKALGGTLDLHWVIQQIIEDLPMCRMNPRRNHPNAYQLLLEGPPSSPGSACQTPEALASPLA